MFDAALGRSCPARAISGPVISAVSVGHGDQPLPGEGGAGLCWSPDSRGTALLPALRDGRLGETGAAEALGGKSPAENAVWSKELGVQSRGDLLLKACRISAAF